MYIPKLAAALIAICKAFESAKKKLILPKKMFVYLISDITMLIVFI